MGTPLSWQFTPEIFATHVLPRGVQGAKETHKVRRDSVEQASFDLQMLARFEVPTNTWDRAIQQRPRNCFPHLNLCLRSKKNGTLGLGKMQNQKVSWITALEHWDLKSLNHKLRACSDHPLKSKFWASARGRKGVMGHLALTLLTLFFRCLI